MPLGYHKSWLNLLLTLLDSREYLPLLAEFYKLRFTLALLAQFFIHLFIHFIALFNSNLIILPSQVLLFLFRPQYYLRFFLACCKVIWRTRWFTVLNTVNLLK